jgi:hypothetical protein
MSNFNWCHGPECHTQHTQSRIRGSGRDKVLRTVKIKVNSHNQYGNSIFDYFCNTRCLYDYLKEHAQAISAIAPRREALETPIKVEKEKYESYRYDWNSGPNNETVRVPYQATRTIIKSVDND